MIIVADLFEVAPAYVLALAALMLSLGLTYWLMRDRVDSRRAIVPVDEPAQPPPAGSTTRPASAPLPGSRGLC